MGITRLLRTGRAVASGVAVLAVAVTAVTGAGVAVSVAPQDRVLADGVYSDGQAGRGRRVYRQACSSCHTDNLEGGEMGPGLVGDSFIGSWDGASLSELMELISVTMPQDNPGGLSEQAYADVLAYMLKANEFPAGDDDLTTELAADVVIEVP